MTLLTLAMVVSPSAHAGVSWDLPAVARARQDQLKPVDGSSRPPSIQSGAADRSPGEAMRYVLRYLMIVFYTVFWGTIGLLLSAVDRSGESVIWVARQWV